MSRLPSGYRRKMVRGRGGIIPPAFGRQGRAFSRKASINPADRRQFIRQVKIFSHFRQLLLRTWINSGIEQNKLFGCLLKKKLSRRFTVKAPGGKIFTPVLTTNRESTNTLLGLSDCRPCPLGNQGKTLRRGQDLGARKTAPGEVPLSQAAPADNDIYGFIGR